jgi:hypothetical protein
LPNRMLRTTTAATSTVTAGRRARTPAESASPSAATPTRCCRWRSPRTARP